MRGLAEIEREEFLVVDALNGADSAAQWNTLVAKRHALATEKAAYLRAHSDELRKSAAEYNWNGFVEALRRVLSPSTGGAMSQDNPLPEPSGAAAGRPPEAVFQSTNHRNMTLWTPKGSVKPDADGKCRVSRNDPEMHEHLRGMGFRQCEEVGKSVPAAQIEFILRHGGQAVTGPESHHPDRAGCAGGSRIGGDRRGPEGRPDAP
jgi:hypothetical protein